MTTSVDFNLPENLTIANIQGLHEALEALVERRDCDTVILRGEKVQRADTAGLQLLVAFVNASRERQIKISWDHPSEKLCGVAELLGVEKMIGIH